MSNPIWVALDVPDIFLKSSLIRAIDDNAGGVKVGLELIHGMGTPVVVQCLRDMADIDQIFVDAKLNDIPTTMAKAAARIAVLEVAAFNVMASSGVAGMAAAVKERGTADVYAVTVLTSMEEKDCLTFCHRSISNLVNFYVLQAVEAGVQGIICSAQQLPMLRAEPDFQHLKFVTPGIRSAGGEVHDQKQVSTPAAAMKNGAYRLVIGREITEDQNPGMVCRRILSDIAAAQAAE